MQRRLFPKTMLCRNFKNQATTSFVFEEIFFVKNKFYLDFQAHEWIHSKCIEFVVSITFFFFIETRGKEMPRFPLQIYFWEVRQAGTV